MTALTSLLSHLRSRKALRWIAGSAGALLLLLLAAPYALYLKQAEIRTWFVAELNASFAGELVVGHSYISPFKAFPYVSVVLQEVQFFAEKDQQGPPLYEVDDLYLGFGLIQALRGDYQVKRLRVKGGHLDLVADRDGQLNLLTAKGMTEAPADSQATAAPLQLDVKQIDLEDFTLSYYQLADSLSLRAVIDEAQAKLRLEGDHLFARLESALVFTAANAAGPTFFHDKHLDLSLGLDYDQSTLMLNLERGELGVEGARFELSGEVDLCEGVVADLRMQGEKPDFSLLLALGPPELAEALAPYQHGGRIFFDGHIQGPIGGGEMPFVEATFGCEEVYFLRTTNAQRLDDFGFRGYFSNGPERSLRSAILRIENLQAIPRRGVFRGNLLVRNFEDPHVAINVHSDLDLEYIGAFVGIEGLQRVTGQVILDMDFSELMDFSLPENTLLQLRQGISSDLIVKDLTFLLPDYPHPIERLNLHAYMRAGRLEVDSLTLHIGQSDLRLEGSLSDLPALFHPDDQPLDLRLRAEAQQLDFHELLAYDSTLAARMDEVLTDFRLDLHMETSVRDLLDSRPLPRGHFFIDDLYAKLQHYPHTLHDFHADLLIYDSTVVLRDFSGEIDRTDFHFSGTLANYLPWFEAVPRGESRFDFDLVSHHLGLADLLTYRGINYLPPDYQQEVIQELALHGTVKLTLDSTLRAADLTLGRGSGRLRVHPLKLENFHGQLHYEDDQLTLTDFGGRLGQSDFRVDLAYFLGTDRPLSSPPNRLHLRAAYLDLDALTAYDPGGEPVAHEEAFNVFTLPFPDLAMEASVDRLTYHRLQLAALHTRLRSQSDHYLYIDTLRMQAAGGTLAMQGYFNGSDTANIYLNSRIWLDQIDLDQFLFKFENFGQDYLISDNLHGAVSGSIQSKLHVYPDLTPILADSEGHLELRIVEGSLVNFAPLEAMAAYFQDRNLQLVRFDTLRNTLDLKGGTLYIPAMTINSSLGFIELSGQQGLDDPLPMSYLVGVPLQLVTEVGFRSLFRGRKRAEVDPDQEDAIIYRDTDRRQRFLNLVIEGTPDTFDVRLGK